MPMLSLGQAARLAGVGKTTISRAIAAGRLSAGRNTEGGYEIDPAELSRVYEIKLDAAGKPVPRDGGAERAAIEGDLSPSEKAELRSMLAVLEERIEGLKSTLDSERRRADAAEADRDRWAKQAETVAGLLPAPADEKKPGLMGRVFGVRKAG